MDNIKFKSSAEKALDFFAYGGGLCYNADIK